MTSALVAGFVEKQYLRVEILQCTSDGLITALVDDAVEFPLQVSHIQEQLIFLGVVVSVVKADKPPGVDTVELTFDEVFHIPFQALGLPALFLLY